MTPRREPPPAVLEAFGAVGPVTPLAGGRGRSVRAGDLVLKPLDLLPAELAWQARVLPSVDAHVVRVAAPVATTAGSLVVDGWTAWPWLEGVPATGRWEDVIAAGNALHAVLAAVPRPAFVDERDHAWAVADRVAWEERSIEPFIGAESVRRLAALRRPSGDGSGSRPPDQVVHGDLSGNVLFAGGLPPAVIDLAAYWRPPLYAAAIVTVDAVTWHGADPALVGLIGHDDVALQALVRAAIFRAVTDLLLSDGRDVGARQSPAQTAAHRAVVSVLERLARSGRDGSGSLDASLQCG